MFGLNVLGLVKVLDNMLDLWAAAEEDMFDMKNHYRLMNTGQGLQRVQVINLPRN